MSKKSKEILIIGFVAGVILLCLGFVLSKSNVVKIPTTSESLVPTVKTDNVFSYDGQQGVTALNLLKAKTLVEEGQSGFVVSINGRKANDKKNEFWAFYVNGVQAQVGAAEYITADADKIVWRIETY